MVIAIGVRETGDRDILGFALGASEEEASWLDFLRSLVRQGLKGVRLVTSDAHEGLKSALDQVLSRASWQRCRVHFMRNILAHMPKGDKAIVAAAHDLCPTGSRGGRPAVGGSRGCDASPMDEGG
ncbi:MAG: hypothetical protein BMS9Abin28_1125 [Anaerolineae bacterium]|nr:MAG: hypothetical protein BMS9Abin28_1125 [Anaerolineae bacterium]